VRVASTDAVRIGEGRGVHLKGEFDWRLAGDPIRVDSPFELYLQRGERNQSWRLARPSGSTAATASNDAGADTNAASSVQEWTTYPLPLPGERS